MLCCDLYNLARNETLPDTDHMSISEIIQIFTANKCSNLVKSYNGDISKILFT